MKFRRSKKRAQIWQGDKIPAGLFFDILKTDNLSMLVRQDIPKNTTRRHPPASVLRKEWDKIIDLYHQGVSDGRMRQIIERKKEILRLSRIIAEAKAYCYALMTTDFTRGMLDEIIDALVKIDIHIDKNKPITDELLRVMKHVVPGLETNLRFEKYAHEKLVEGEQRTFHQTCAIYETYGFNVGENVSLGRFLAYTLAAREIAKNNKEQEAANK